MEDLGPVISLWGALHTAQLALLLRSAWRVGDPGGGWVVSAVGSLPSFLWWVVLAAMFLAEPSPALLGIYAVAWLASLILVPVGGLLVAGAAFWRANAGREREGYATRLAAIPAVAFALYALAKFNPSV